MIPLISYGLFCGVLPGLCVRLVLTCAHGSHVCCDVCAVMVEMCVSYYDNLLYSVRDGKGSIFIFIFKNFF